MGIPIKLKVDDFSYLGEAFNKGDIFNAPHETMVSFMCDQEGTASRVKESTLEPEQVGTMKRELKGGYDTKVMTPNSGSKTPTKTKGGSKAKGKSSVKAASNESTKDT